MQSSNKSRSRVVAYDSPGALFSFVLFNSRRRKFIYTTLEIYERHLHHTLRAKRIPQLFHARERE